MRRPLLPLILLPLIWLSAGCDLFTAPAADTGAIQVETAPPGAAVTCNGGAPRISPAAFDNLPPGLYMLTARKAGFQEARQTLSLMGGQKTAVQMPLEPILGLVLVHSLPAGAQVSVDGAFRGTTPLLIPDFPLGTHRLRFGLAGFEEKEIELTIKDRTPLKTSVDLASKTATLDITSEPAGAAVYIDNAPRGATPCEVEATADAEARVELKLEGFVPFSETIKLQAGGRYPVKARLLPLPADLEVTSTPAGARVFVDGTFKGVTPVTISGLSRGDHKLAFDMKGYEPQERVVALNAAGKMKEDAALVRNSGTLVLITAPAGAEVFVDGEAMGVTAASPAGGGVSEPLRADLLSRGEHTLQLTRRGYSFKPVKFTIEAGQVVQLQETLARLFIRDTVVVIRKDGGRYEVTGQLLRKLPNGDVEIEVNPGIIQKLDAASISEMRPLKTETP
jgi:hypothetical protein